VKRVLSLLLIGCVLSSCALISHGTSEVISVDSNPSGADATIKCNNKISASGTTPAKLTIPRKADGCRVTVAQSGMHAQTVEIERGFTSSFWLNFVPAAGLAVGTVAAFTGNGSDDVVGGLFIAGFAGGIGFIIDRLSGAMYDHNPSVIKVTLQPEH
jgi:hypothetical protein